MKCNVFFYMILLLVLSSCSGSKIVVSRDYNGRSLNAHNLNIQIMPVDIDPDIEKSFGWAAGADSGETGYVTFFKEHFPEFVLQYSSFRNVTFTEDFSSFTRDEFKLDRGNTVYLNIPATAESPDKSDEKASYTLILDNLILYRKKSSDDMIMPSRGTVLIIGGAEQKLCHSGTFLIWDNVNKQVVSYGKIDEKTKYEDQGIIGTCMKAFEKISRLIFMESPFRSV